jgi:catechol 2,3-dioxygenase-like lactoylglutathione lyase family enzyme
MKLRQAMIFVKRLDLMTAFYRDGLGLRPLPDRSEEGFAVFDAGGTHLALHAIPPALAKTIQIADPPEARADTPIKLFFEVDDLAEARAHLARRGAIMSEPNSWGGCDGLDPEGNVFTIVDRR